MAVLEKQLVDKGQSIKDAKTIYDIFPGIKNSKYKNRELAEARRYLIEQGYMYERRLRNGKPVTLYFKP